MNDLRTAINLVKSQVNNLVGFLVFFFYSTPVTYFEIIKHIKGRLHQRELNLTTD
jgi:hypothetical protein